MLTLLLVLLALFGGGWGYSRWGYPGWSPAGVLFVVSLSATVEARQIPS